MASSNDVLSVYKSVVDDVINNVKEAFLDEGVDEQVLLELKQMWESKMMSSKALEPAPEPKIHLTAPSVGMLFQGQPAATQSHQGYIARGGVLTTAVQQPAQAVLATAQPTELTGAAQQATMALPVGLFQQQFAALGGQPGLTLQPTANGQYIAVQNIGGQTTTFTIPQQALLGAQPQPVIAGQPVSAATVTQAAPNPTQQGIVQLDGTADDGSSSSEDDDFDNDDNDEDDEVEDHNDEEAEEGQEEEPLNSGDDVSEEDPADLFECDHVIVCQYDKINRIKNKWKFQLKDGIMNLNGKDFIFQRATGDAEW